jgi:hypothetical protein
MRHLVPITALAVPAAPAWAAGTAPPGDLPLLGFILFVAAIAFGLGRFAWQLRRDFLGLLATAPREPGGADRLEILRDAPAGMPQGSVRAVLAIAIVLVTLPALVLAQALGLAGTGELGTILGGVIGFYFGSRGTGGEAETARRQTDAALREAEAARGARSDAEQRAEAANVAAASAAATGARDAAEATSRLADLRRHAAEGAAVVRAVGALLPGGAAAPAIEAALADPSPASLAGAVQAAATALQEAGEGTELATRLQGALEAVAATAGAVRTVQGVLADPTPERLAAAIAAAASAAGRHGDGGLGAVLAPALGTLGQVMKLPGLAGALGVAGPAGLVGGLLLGAWQAARLGRQHYLRWMARVLDRPVSRDLFPAGEWDGEAARALIADVPRLAAALAPRLAPDAPQAGAAEALARLLDPGAGAWLWREAPGAFASEAEAETTAAAFRRRVLEAELDRADPAPVTIAPGLALPQTMLRRDLDAVREAGGAAVIDQLALLADGLVGTRPAPGVEVPDLLRRGLAAAGGVA